MAFAIARVAKVKGMQHLSKAANHNMRSVPVPNAAPGTGGAIVLAGSDDPAGDVISRLPVDSNGEIKVRKNAVWAMEHLLTASPEYFRPDNPGAAGQYDESRMEAWKDRAMRFLHDRYGDNLAHAVLHLDEATPHIQALVVPRREDGKLDAAKLFDPDALVRMQSDYADCMADIGLERGIEGSKAKHESIKAYYGRVNAPDPEISTIKTPSPKDIEAPTLAERIPGTAAYRARKAAEKNHDNQSERRKKEVAKRRNEVLKAAPIWKAKSKEFDARTKANEARNKAAERLRENANRVRDIPLSVVFERLECKPDRRDKKNWDTPAGRISVKGQKWYNHDLDVGGGGAIDLVMHLAGADYKGALAYLGAELGTDSAVSAALARTQEEAAKAATEKAPSLIPEPRPEHIGQVREYLVKRGINARLVDHQIERKRIFATAVESHDRVYVNAAFRLESSDGEGVEMRGVSGKYHGMRGKKGVYSISTAKEYDKAVFVESSIEALSYATLALERGEKVKAISTGGSAVKTLQNAVQAEIDKGVRVVPAFNTDAAGKRFSERVTAMSGEQPEEPPFHQNDWNDYLRNRVELEQHAKIAEEFSRSESTKKQDRDHGHGLIL